MKFRFYTNFLDNWATYASLGAMTRNQILKIYNDNRDYDWKKAHEVALASFLDEGKSYAEAMELADERMLKVNWILAKGAEWLQPNTTRLMIML